MWPYYPALPPSSSPPHAPESRLIDHTPSRPWVRDAKRGLGLLLCFAACLPAHHTPNDCSGDESCVSIDLTYPVPLPPFWFETLGPAACLTGLMSHGSVSLFCYRSQALLVESGGGEKTGNNVASRFRNGLIDHSLIYPGQQKVSGLFMWSRCATVHGQHPFAQASNEGEVGLRGRCRGLPTDFFGEGSVLCCVLRVVRCVSPVAPARQHCRRTKKTPDGPACPWR